MTDRTSAQGNERPPFLAPANQEARSIWSHGSGGHQVSRDTAAHFAVETGGPILNVTFLPTHGGERHRQPGSRNVE